MSKWISFRERKPELSGEYIVFSESLNVTVSWYYAHAGQSFGAPYVTHWMPLPEPPEQESE